ncbi:MAG: hypothetical protein JW738_10375 [Actinobacteria bacterium]|nr:hypothetical protein [Actinomycetota bacterium]
MVTREYVQNIIDTWKNGIPNRDYDATVAFWAEDGRFSVYEGKGNPRGWGSKITKIGPQGARFLFSEFHDTCETTLYDVRDISIDVENKRASWVVIFEGGRDNEHIEMENAFMIDLNERGEIVNALIWTGNP